MSVRVNNPSSDVTCFIIGSYFLVVVDVLGKV